MSEATPPDDLDMDDEYQQVERLLSRRPPSWKHLGDDLRLDPPQPLAGSAHRNLVAAAGAARRQQAGLSWGWGLLAAGLAAFMCGTSLAGWGWFADRMDLVGVGLPAILIGQLGLVIGVVLLLDAVWEGHRQIEERMTETSGQLVRLAAKLPEQAR